LPGAALTAVEGKSSLLHLGAEHTPPYAGHEEYLATTGHVRVGEGFEQWARRSVRSSEPRAVAKPGRPDGGDLRRGAHKI